MLVRGRKYELVWTSAYLVVLVASFLGSIIPFGPALYLGGITLAALDSTLDPAITVACGATGATLAKTVIFRASSSFRRTRVNTRLRNIRLLQIVMRHGWLAAVLAAATPIPDELVAIPLGLSGYNTWRFFASTLVGKSILISLIVWGVREHGTEFLQIV